MKRKLIVFGILAAYWAACFIVSAGVWPAQAQDNAKIGAGRAGVYSAWHLSGFNADIATTEETIWDQGGAYAYPASASVMSVSSSSANDTSAGTGARTVRVTGLNSLFEPFVETVTLNGQTAVNTTTSIRRVNGVEVLTAGSGGVNAGDIYVGTGTVTAGVPANKYGKIVVAQNRSLAAVYTVPAGKRAMLENLTVVSQATSTSTVTIRLVARATGAVFQTMKKFLITSAAGAVTIPNEIPLLFQPGTDIEVRATTSASGEARDVAADATFIVVN